MLIDPALAKTGKTQIFFPFAEILKFNFNDDEIGLATRIS